MCIQGKPDTDVFTNSSRARVQTGLDSGHAPGTDLRAGVKRSADVVKAVLNVLGVHEAERE